MSQLVFIQDSQVITDSLTIAEMFGKDYDKVVRDSETQNSTKRMKGNGVPL
ncbi:hypothetical protein [Metasolibacillus fluoroglycofenilyticus]|uniref:hypothetical protein n=1 Tax=Metasolibacillus fluoroglycofenilyticus TaxID=1239396 RepID=UPI001379D0E6|nr:hypothetical protein [Metasolibacillus fluoroglycofenilyticus]